MIDLGKRKPGSTIYRYFATYDSNDPTASVTMTGFAVTGIEIYKKDSMTQRASDSGYTLIDTDGIDIDSTTGIHGYKIDLSDNTDSGFYTNGDEFVIVVNGMTVDGGSVSKVDASFRIGYDGSILDTTIDTLASQTSFTLTAGPVDNDALNDCIVLVHDVASAVQIAKGFISDYTGASKTITLAADPGIFTMAAGDNISIFLPSNIEAIRGTSQTANDNGADINTLITRIAQTLNLTALGNIGIDWANVENPGSTVDLSDTSTNLVDTCTTNTDMVSEPPTAAAIVNEWESQSQADPTGFHVNVKEVNDTAQTANDNSADINEILSRTISSAAAANLEDNFDGTGYVADTAPATQAQLSNIANVGAAVNKPASSYTLTTGTQSANTYADTEELDGVKHTHTDDAGSMDLYYEFLIGGGTPTQVIVVGALTGLNDDLEVQGYDWVSSSWKQIGVINGKASSDNETNAYSLYVNMVGTGANLGKVRIRFTDGVYTLTTATLYIDQIYVSFAQGSGDYANGEIWVDTNASNTNTVVGVDGVSTNPVSTWAAALTLSAATNIKSFHIANGSAITLTANSDYYCLRGTGWTLALNGQSITNACFEGADVITGTGTGAGIYVRFIECGFAAATIPPCIAITCGFGQSGGTITAGSAGDFHFSGCNSAAAGSGTPVFDFSGTGSTTNINFRGWMGGTEITLDSDCTLSLEVHKGGGQTIVTGGADVEIRGVCRSLNITMSSNETVQFVGTTGPVTLAGTTTGTVNLYGVIGTLTDNTVTASTTNNAVSAEQQDLQAVETTLTAIKGVGWTTETLKAIYDAVAAIGGDATLANQVLILASLVDAKGATFDTSTDSLEAIRNRGDAAWITGGGLSGSNAITFTITDDDSGAVIPECALEIWSSTNDSFYEKQFTDSAGQVSSNIDDGTYTVRLHKGGYTFDNQTLVVSAAASVSYTGTALAPTAPSSGDNCRVYEYLKEADGVSIPESVESKARIVSLPEDTNDTLHTGEDIDGTYDSDTGLLYWDILRTAEAEFIIEKFGVKVVKTVPDSSTVRLSDI